LPSPREKVSTPGEKRKATPVDPRSAKEPRGSSNTTEQEKREKVCLVAHGTVCMLKDSMPLSVFQRRAEKRFGSRWPNLLRTLSP
jgi:hypothetical protein